MSFLRPEFLWALPLTALPILIHLLNRQRFQVVEFSAMDFLRQAIRRTRRRMILEDLLLLILRTLAVLLLILALARPGADPGSLLSTRSARAEILVLDSSLSMAHRSQGASAFERAVSAGVGRIEPLEAGRGDRAAIILAGTRAERLAYGDPSEVQVVLEEQDRPGRGVADMASALAIARRTAASLGAEGLETVRVTILTDMQASGWDLEGDEGNGLRNLASDGNQLAILDTGAGIRANTAVTWIDVEPAEISPGDFAEVHARVRQFGPKTRRGIRAALFLDGVSAGNPADFDLAPGEEKELNWTVSSAEAGPRVLEIRLDGDALPADDWRARILPVRSAPRILLVGEAVPRGKPEQVFDQLLHFLDLGENAPLQLSMAPPSRVDARRLEETDVVLLADPGPVSSSLSGLLADYSGRGGGVLMALGRNTGGPECRGFLEALGNPGLEVGEVVDCEDIHARLSILDPSHPALKLFDDPRWKPLLTEVPYRRYRMVRETGGSGGARPALSIPLRFVRSKNGEGEREQGAAMAEWMHGSGHVVLLAAVPDPLWNRMAEVPGGTLPFLFDLLAHLAPRPRHPLQIEVGSPLEVELPAPPTEISYTDPSGRSGQPLGNAVPQGGGPVLVPILESVPDPGVWTVAARILDREGREVLHSEKIAVQVPVRESDLAPLDSDVIRAALPPGTEFGRGLDSTEIVSPEDSTPRPRDLSGFFFTLLVGILAVETLLAGWLDRRRG